MRKYLLAIAILAILAGCNKDDPGAQQFVFFDDELVQDSAGVPALTRLGPENLLSPVNYIQGNLYMRFEIIDKPSDLSIRPAYFIWQDEKDWPDMGHMGMGRSDVPDCKDVGVYYIDCMNPEEWWHGDYPVPDWTRAFDKMALVPWVGNMHEQFLSVDCHDYCFSSGEIADHTPIVYRATGIWVPPGKKLVPPPGWDVPEEWLSDQPLAR